MTEQAPRPLPRPDQDSQPYWDAMRQGRLLLQRNRVDDVTLPRFRLAVF